MAKTVIMGLILLLGLPLHLSAGELTDIKVGKQTKEEIEILIEGAFDTYHGVSLLSPARFVIVFENAQLKEGVSSSIQVEGSIVSGIKTVSQAKDVRVILESANTSKLFHCTMHDKEGKVIVKCWMPAEASSRTKNTSKADASESDESLALHQKNLNEIFGWPKKAQEEPKGKEANTLDKYTGEKITLDFYKTDLQNVFRLFAELSGKNLIIDDQVKGELTLALKEVPWDSAMDLILDLKGLVKEERLGTYIIKPKPAKSSEEKGELVVKTFSEEILQPARILKKEKEDRQQAQDLIIEAHNLEALGKKEEALTVYEKAYTLWKDNSDLIMKTAFLHYSLGRYAKSYYFAGQALNMNPNNSEAALFAALSAAQMDNSKDARQLFEIAIAGRPEIPEAYFNYAQFLKNQKEYSDALSIYQKHERIFGPSVEVSLAVAGIYEAQGRTVKACTKYREIQKSGFNIDKKAHGLIHKKIQTLCN